MVNIVFCSGYREDYHKPRGAGGIARAGTRIKGRHRHVTLTLASGQQEREGGQRRIHSLNLHSVVQRSQFRIPVNNIVCISVYMDRRRYVSVCPSPDYLLSLRLLRDSQHTSCLYSFEECLYSKATQPATIPVQYSDPDNEFRQTVAGSYTVQKFKENLVLFAHLCFA